MLFTIEIITEGCSTRVRGKRKKRQIGLIYDLKKNLFATSPYSKKVVGSVPKKEAQEAQDLDQHLSGGVKCSPNT